jgi:Tfp pilus assembly protein PilF
MKVRSKPQRRLSAPPLWTIALLIAATIVGFASTLRNPLIFDDVPAIVENPTIRSLSDVRAVFSPPAAGNTVSGRPLLNFSFALNYALGGTNPLGYHLANLALHGCAALLLFGILRRTLRRPPLQKRFATAADPLALLVALLWLLHPLQSESVTYVAQRAESLMGLLYLLTLYAFIRSVENRPRSGWAALAVVACYAGMATKEVMVTAPILVVLYDRLFVAGSFRAVWQTRSRFYLLLFSSWVLLAILVIGAGDRGGTIGSAAGMSPWQYGLCQARGVWRYFGLSGWPHPLILDYGADFVSFTTALPYFLAIAALGGVLLWAVVRRSPAAFAVACSLGILVPSSSVVGGSRQMLAEHRMYLSLAWLIAVAVCAAYRVLGRRALLATGLAIGACGTLLIVRNQDYRSELSIWTDTVRKRPANAIAHYNLGVTFLRTGDREHALAEFETAIRLDPGYAIARTNLASLRLEQGDVAAAIAEYRRALELKPDLIEAHANLGYLLNQTGQPEAAIREYAVALRLQPDSGEIENNLAIALLAAHRPEEALLHSRKAVALTPTSAAAHNTLGTVYARLRRLAEAGQEFVTALRLDPSFVPAAQNLARIRNLEPAR